MKNKSAAISHILDITAVILFLNYVFDVENAYTVT